MGADNRPANSGGSAESREAPAAPPASAPLAPPSRDTPAAVPIAPERQAITKAPGLPGPSSAGPGASSRTQTGVPSSRLTGAVDPVADERTLLDEARVAVEREDGAAALVTTEEHARRYPRGILVQEREAIAVRALVLLGRIDEARARVDRFRQAFSGQPPLARARIERRDSSDAVTKEPGPPQAVPGSRDGLREARRAMRLWRSWVGVLACVAIAGCGAHSLDIGSTDAGLVADVEVSTLPLGPSLDAGGVTAQVWVGHLENHQFPDGSDTLTMTLDFAPGGEVTGSLLLGNGARLQPPTDPNVGYPPGNAGAVTLVEGFAYTILDGILSGSHLGFHFSEYEVWSQWCALQTSYLYDPGSDAGPVPVAPSYGCVPVDEDGGALWFAPTGCGQLAADGGMSTFDCGKLRLCVGRGSAGAWHLAVKRAHPLTPGPSTSIWISRRRAPRAPCP